MIKGNFIDNLPRVYGIYTGGFLGFIIIMAIGEQMGMTAKAIGICFVAFTVAIYAMISTMYCATCVQVTPLIPPNIEHSKILTNPT